MKHLFRTLILLVTVASARGATVANQFTTNTPFTTFRQLVGTNVSAKVIVTNATTFDGGALITSTVPVSNVNNSNVAIQLMNCNISGVTFSNAAASVSGGSLLGIALNSQTSATNIVFNNVRVYGQDSAMYFDCSIGVIVPSWIGAFYDSYFYGANAGVETWHGSARWYNSTFICTNGTDSCVPFTSNDDSVNEFWGAEFDNDNTSGFDAGYIGYARSTNIFHDCTFQRRKAPTDSSSKLYWSSEATTSAEFNHCKFRPFGALVLTAVDDTPSDIFFNDCYVLPATNGVVITTLYPIRVRGGNLVPANFDDPTKVIWLDSGGAGIAASKPNFTIVNTNFVQGFIYSNSFGAPMQLTVNIRATTGTAAGGGDAQMDLQQPAGTLVARVGQGSASTLVAETNNFILTWVIPVNGTYAVTNTISTGTGYSVSVNSGQIFVY